MACSSPFPLLRSLSAIKIASSPQEAMWVFKTTIACSSPTRHDPLISHVVVSLLKACSRLMGLPCPSFFRHLHAHLLKTALHAHVYVGTALLHAYVLSSFSDARRLFDEMPVRNTVTCNTMISGYARQGHLQLARCLFERMPQRDVASWSAMIGAYLDMGVFVEAFQLFRTMILTDEMIKPDQQTLVPLLSCCASRASYILLGKSIHAYSLKSSMEINVQLGTVLIDMYAKSGCLRNAYTVFDEMPEKKVMTWSAMICGLAMHGHGHAAMDLFKEMKEKKVRPNEITFTGVLNACCHAGLVEEGKKSFNVMVEEFALSPSVHHSGCMVELLGKAGLVDEAFDLVEKMKGEPNIVILTSLLASCKMHRRLDVAEMLIGRVLGMADPEVDGGIYTLVSDLYAMAGKWADVESVRVLMDRVRVKKKRGLSLI
ncbi:pentatricopeptide repeat-containing protein At1g33350-like [Wolffia australiana]